MFLPWAPIQDLDGNRPVLELAQRYDVMPRQVVLAWLLARSPSILPIPGTGSVPHLEDNLAAAAIKLTPADVASVTCQRRLSTPSSPPGYYRYPVTVMGARPDGVASRHDNTLVHDVSREDTTSAVGGREPVGLSRE